jgi:hypothetical protein
VDDAVVGWLADATGTPVSQVAAELELGERRRAFVIGELRDAGLTGTELLNALMHVTGVDEREARELLR